MNIWVIVGNIALPILSVVGIIVIYFHQKSRIGNLERALKNVTDYMGIFNLDQVRKYSTLGEERAKFDFEKDLVKIQADFDKETEQTESNAASILTDSIELLILLILPIAESRYVNDSINKLPDGIIKYVANGIHDRIRKINGRRFDRAELGKKIDDLVDLSKYLESKAK